MPLYEYQCPQCGRFELIRKFSDDPLKTCPTCGNEVHKLLSSPAVHFKGTGWYITDYARKGASESKSEKSDKAESKSESKSEKSESKSDSKSSDSSSTSSTPSTSSTTSTGSDTSTK